MNHFDFEEVDFAAEVIEAIEKDYGVEIARVAKFEKSYLPDAFEMTVIFKDFKMLEAKVSVVPFFLDMPSIQVEGVYY